MGDSEGPKPNSIPSWQRQEPSTSLKQPDNNTPPQEPAEQESSEPRASLIEKASKFLEDDSIRDASIERKKPFLESKGLSESEINDLLETQQTPEAAVIEDYGIERQEASNPTAPTTPQKPPTPSMSPQQQPLPAVPSKDNNPPIITYPEFLLHAQKPAPLLTAPRLLTTLYIASGLAATIYGTSKYVVEPMVSNLTTARHSLFESSGANISALNEKLEGAVSEIPVMIPLYAKKLDDDSDATEVISSDDDDDDGARFFNRSAGTQTSPRLSRSDSSSSSSLDTDERVFPPVENHMSGLLGLHDQLSDLLPADAESANALGDSISELRAYLEKMPYASSIHSGGSAGKNWEMDAVANVKAEIRGVKGVLLSARNFPSGVAGR